MSNKTLSIFNPFSLQLGLKRPLLVIIKSALAVPMTLLLNNGPKAQANCQLCIDLIHDMLAEIQAIHGFINGCESAANGALNVNIRKVAGLYCPHDLAILKELHAKPPPITPAKRTAPKAKAFGCY